MADADDDDEVELGGRDVSFPPELLVPLTTVTRLRFMRVGYMGLDGETEPHQLPDLDANEEMGDGKGVGNHFTVRFAIHLAIRSYLLTLYLQPVANAVI
jgi:hypothetical protein